MSTGHHPASRGDRYLTLTVVAECYEVELRWVRDVYDFGLLGEGRLEHGELAISTVMLERVAVIRRLQLQLGINLPGVALQLEELGL